MSNITSEIANRIFEDINIFNSNLVGLNNKKLILPEKYWFRAEFDREFSHELQNSNLKIEFNSDKTIVYFPVFSGKISIGDFELSALFLNSSILNEKELCLIFSSLGKVYAIYSSDEKTLFKVLTEKSWQNTSVKTQANLLIGFEDIASFGLDWVELKDFQGLHSQMLNFLTQHV